MAISANAVWEIRTTGAQTNGGFFVTGASGSDFSQQAAAQYALTGVTTAAADAILLTASAAADMVGNGCYIVSGTNFTVGWYEIISVVIGVSITLDRTCTTAAGSNGVVNIGGAFKIGGTLDDDVFEAADPGHTYWIKQGTYTLGETVSVSASGAGSSTKLVSCFGYNSTRGDNPTTLSTMPIINGGTANQFSLGSYWSLKNIVIISGTNPVTATGTNSFYKNCKVINTSTTATRVALNATGYTFVEDCEIVSMRGTATSPSGSIHPVWRNCWIHDSDIGFLINSTSAIINCTKSIISSCVTAAIKATTSNVVHSDFDNVTLYGAENKQGNGLDIATGTYPVRLSNSIIYGFVTGCTHADNPIGSMYDNYNNYYNNTTDVGGGWTKGANDLAVNPSFASVTQRTGTTATISGTTITQSGATFSTWGIRSAVNGVPQDWIYVKSGTGATVGIYGIVTVDSETQLTLNATVGTNATTDKVWQITQGNNFRPGVNLKGTGSPGAFPGALSTGYMDIGAVQRQEDYPAVGDVKTGVSYGGGDYTGTQANIESGSAQKFIHSGDY